MRRRKVAEWLKFRARLFYSVHLNIFFQFLIVAWIREYETA